MEGGRGDRERIGRDRKRERGERKREREACVLEVNIDCIRKV